jgi:hypothetical protein
VTVEECCFLRCSSRVVSPVPAAAAAADASAAVIAVLLSLSFDDAMRAAAAAEDSAAPSFPALAPVFSGLIDVAAVVAATLASEAAIAAVGVAPRGLATVSLSRRWACITSFRVLIGDGDRCFVLAAIRSESHVA